MFFDRLSEACAIRNTSPSAVALQIGRSKSNVTGWKKGQIPSSDTLTALAEKLNIPTDFLLERPPFDCWDLIDQNRKGFLYYVDVDPLDLELMWGIDPDQPDKTPADMFIRFLRDAIISARPTQEGDWIVEVQPTYKREKAPTLTKKDERDIARDLEAIMAELEAGGDMMFDGDPMTPKARESIMSAMRLGLEAAKAKNKERFTPHKYRKE